MRTAPYISEPLKWLAKSGVRKTVLPCGRVLAQAPGPFRTGPSFRIGNLECVTKPEQKLEKKS